MARPRSNTALLAREGHSLSLKVLRLSRPSLAQQYPLPHSNTAKIPHEVSLAYPSKSNDQDFILSNILTLPPAFGSAHVGETFSCALCANNELASDVTTKSVTDIHLTAEIQTPTQTFPLELHASSDHSNETVESMPGSSLQRIIKFPLTEEGNHTLTVGVSYVETIQSSDSTAASSPPTPRVRTFRKMYQFIAQPCLNIRTKATKLGGVSQTLRYTLEAQVENVSDSRIILEHTKLLSQNPLKAICLSRDRKEHDHEASSLEILNPRDVVQVTFLVEQDPNVNPHTGDSKSVPMQDGRVVLGQIKIDWRGQMGERGVLNTGNLLTRK